MLEKLTHDQIVEYFREKETLDPIQAGLKTQSIKIALMKLVDNIRTGIDKRLLTVLLLFDFSKAFDTTLPFKLLYKLKALSFQVSFPVDMLLRHWKIPGRGLQFKDF